MKSLIQAVAIAAALAAPVASFAQADQQPVTRAQVRNDLIRVEQAGYNPAVSSDPTYPSDVQAAERRVQAQDASVAQTRSVADTSGYGSDGGGSSQSGAVSMPASGQKGIYFGH